MKKENIFLLFAADGHIIPLETEHFDGIISSRHLADAKRKYEGVKEIECEKELTKRYSSSLIITKKRFFLTNCNRKSSIDCGGERCKLRFLLKIERNWNRSLLR